MSPSSSTTGSAAGSYADSSRKMTSTKLKMEIQLKNHFRSKVYNTGSPIEGEVVMRTHRDVRFDNLQIILLGLAKTHLEGVGAPHATTHTLLKLTMPVPKSVYPVPRVLEAGRTYRVPFNFVVPPHLTIGACAHRVDADHVRDLHLALPPTVGFWERDDLSPQTARIEYCVKARVLREPDAETAYGIKLMDATQQIKIMPTFPELPPLDLGSGAEGFYRMAKSKMLRKNLMASKVGRVTATAAQPGAVFLRADTLGASETAAHVRLQFEPASADALPPKITGVSGKITAHTFYSSSAMATLPDALEGRGTPQFVLDRRATYSTSVPLFSAHVDGLKWQQQPLRHLARRDSEYSSGDLDADYSDAAAASTLGRKAAQRKRSSAFPVLHTCDIQVPIRLPVESQNGKGRTFIPSFHSCIISRIYSLQLSVTLAGSGATSGSTTLSLKLPIQIAAEPGVEAAPEAEEPPDFETALEEAEADRHLQPRILSVPDQRFTQTSAFPGYAGYL